MTKILIEVDVAAAVQVSDGVFKTVLSHPTLEGGLHFIHSSKTRTSTLNGLTENPTNGIADVVTLVGDLINGTKRTKTDSKSKNENS